MWNKLVGFKPAVKSEWVIDDESGESTEEDGVTDAGSGVSEIERQRWMLFVTRMMLVDEWEWQMKRRLNIIYAKSTTVYPLVPWRIIAQEHGVLFQWWLSYLIIKCFYSTLADKMLFLCSLFDDGEARYHKLRESVSQFTVTQIGELFTNWLLLCTWLWNVW